VGNLNLKNPVTAVFYLVLCHDAAVALASEAGGIW
jgi:hypothetical protein